MTTLRLPGPPDDSYAIAETQPSAPPADFVTTDPTTGLETVTVTASRIHWPLLLGLVAAATLLYMASERR